MSRTVITAGTTFLAVLSLYLFGGEVLKGFAFTMLVGIVSGTYSTIFIAAAVAILLSKAAAGADPPAAAPTPGTAARRDARPRLRDRLLTAAILGIVQGITEFLPISSSAHLILGRALFGWDSDALGLAFDVAIHLGTLAAVVIYFRDDLIRMTRALPAALSLANDDPAARMVRLVVIGTIPVVIVGVLFADAIEEHLRKPMVTVITLDHWRHLLADRRAARPARRERRAISPGSIRWRSARRRRWR